MSIAEIELAAKDVSTLCNRLLQKVSLARPMVSVDRIQERAEGTYAGNAVVYFRQSIIESLVSCLFRLLGTGSDDRSIGRIIRLLEREVENPSELTEKWIDCRDRLYKDDSAETFLPQQVQALRKKFDTLLDLDAYHELKVFRDEEVAHFLSEGRHRKRLKKDNVEIRSATYDGCFELCKQAVDMGSKAYLLATLSSYTFGPEVYRFYAQEFFERYFGLTEEEFDSAFESLGADALL